MYISRVECRPNVVGVDGTAQYHFRGRRSRCTPTAAGGTVCVHSNLQRHRLTTSRYFTAPFNKAPLYPSRRRVCSNVHHQFTPSSKLHAPPLLQPATAPPGKSAPTASHYRCPRYTFLFHQPEAATLQHLRYSTSTRHDGITT